MAMTVSELQVKVSADTHEAESGLARFGNALQAGAGIGLGMKVLDSIFDGIGTAIKGSVGAAATFEAAMSGIKAVSGATGTEMESLSGLALKLGADTSFSASEAAAGMGELIKAGVSVGDVMGGGAAAALNLAAAGGLSVAESAEIAANSMNIFGIKGSEVGHVADVIAGAANASAIDVHDFGMSLSAAGSVASTVGIGFEDLATATAVMGAAGIKGSDAGTSLKTMLLNLTPSTKSQIAVAKELGIVTADGGNKFFDAAGKARSMSEIAEVLKTSTAGLTEQQKLQALQTLFGTDAIRAAAIMAKAGAEGFDRMAESLGKVTGADVAKTRLDNLKGSIEQLKGSLETAGIELGTLLLPGIRAMVDGLTAGVNAGIGIIKQLPAAWEDVKTIFTEGATAGNLEGLLSQIGLSEGAVITATEWLARIGDAWRTMQQAFSGNWSPSAQIDPFVNSIGIAATKMIEFRDTVLDAVAKASAMGAWDNITSGFNNLKDAVVHAQVGLNDITAALERARGPVGQTATAADVLAGAIKGAALGFQYVTLQISGFVDQIGSSIAVLINFDVAAARVGRALQMFQRGDIPGAIEALGEAKTAFGEALTGAESFRQRGLDRVAEGAQIMADVVSVKLTATASAVETNMSAANTAVSVGSAGWQREMEANGAAVATAAETGMQGVTAATETGMAAAVSAVSAAGPPMSAAAAADGNGVAEAIAAAVPAAAAAAEAMGAGMTSGIETAGPPMAAAAEGAASGAVAAVQGQTGAASGAGQSLGAALGSGMEDGIGAYVGRVAAAAGRLVSAAIGAAHQEADAHSPSKKTEKLGQDMAEGLEIGLNKANIGEEMKTKIRDFISTSRAYIPVAGEIKRVEDEIKTIRDKSQTDALFRAQQMITVDSEALRLKSDMVVKERDLLPLRQDIARATREISDLERGDLATRLTALDYGKTMAEQNVKVNELEKDKIPFRQRELEIERELIGLDPSSKRAKSLKEEQDELRKKESLIDNQIAQIRLSTKAQDLEIASNKEMGTVASYTAKVRKEELAERAIKQEAAIEDIKREIEKLDAERGVFAANEAVIKNATDNEIGYRNRLIAVFTAEGKPLADRITAGLAMVEQLHKEGKISDQLYESIKKVTEKMGGATGATAATTGLGNAAATATPQLDAATKKAGEMAAQAEAIAQQAGAASAKVDALSKSLGKLPDFGSWKNTKTIFGPDAADGGSLSGGSSAIDGMAVIGRSGDTLMPASMGGSSGGDTYVIDARGATIYDGSKFEDMLVNALGRAGRRGRIYPVTRT